MDYCFAYYTRRASQGEAYKAGIWAVWLILFNAFVMVQVIENNETIISAAVGAFVGTYFAVRRDS